MPLIIQFCERMFVKKIPIIYCTFLKITFIEEEEKKIWFFRRIIFSDEFSYEKYGI